MLNQKRLLVGLACIILVGCAGGIFGLQQPSSSPNLNPSLAVTPPPSVTVIATPTPTVQPTPTPSLSTVAGPKITKITPDSGKAGEYVTIEGEKFLDKGNLIFKRNDSTYDIKTATWNDNRIVFTIPSELSQGVYQVIAKTGDSESNGMSFAVMSEATSGGGGGGGGSSSYTPPTNPPDTPPTVNITAPADSASVTSPVNIAITASDAQTSVSKVELYEGAILLTTLTTSPYSYDWSTSTGAKTIKAKAYDTANKTTEVTRNFTVTGSCLLTGNISSPSDGASGLTSPVSVTVTASGETVTKIEVYDGASLLATLTTSPYNYSWTVTNGSHALKMKAYGQTCNFEHTHNITVGGGGSLCGCSGPNLQSPNIDGITTNPVKNGPTNTVTLSSAGSTVELSASGVSDPDGCLTLCYRWYYRQWGGNWTLISDWNNSSSTRWTTPSTPDSYEVKCEVWDSLYMSSAYVNVVTPSGSGTYGFNLTF